MTDEVTRRSRSEFETQPMRKTVRSSRLRYAVRTEINQRDNNEDSFYLGALPPAPDAEPIYLLAVADGMGGCEHGEQASREALRKLNLALYESLVALPGINRLNHAGVSSYPRRAELGRQLMSALMQANDHLLRMIASNKWEKSGTTIVAAALFDDTAAVVNLGDSPLFLFRAGVLTRITEDHNIAGALLRAGMISPEMALHHEGRSRLEFHLGAKDLPPNEPLRLLTLEANDMLLLCSDGVSGRLAEGQIAKILAEAGADLDRAADKLIETARAAGETDNQTLILWRC
jgi:PPM family protein phosphatase